MDKIKSAVKGGDPAGMDDPNSHLADPSDSTQTLDNANSGVEKSPNTSNTVNKMADRAGQAQDKANEAKQEAKQKSNESSSGGSSSGQDTKSEAKNMMGSSSSSGRDDYDSSSRSGGSGLQGLESRAEGMMGGNTSSSSGMGSSGSGLQGFESRAEGLMGRGQSSSSGIDASGGSSMAAVEALTGGTHPGLAHGGTSSGIGGSSSSGGGLQSGMENAAFGQEDYGDKGLSAIEGKMGMSQNRMVNEKIGDTARGEFEQATGKQVPKKFSN